MTQTLAASCPLRHHPGFPFLAQAATESEVEALKKELLSCANATRPSRTP